jgi:hypothetical protein
MLGKATFSAGSGSPVSFVLNLLLLPLFATFILNNPIGSAIVIGLIYSSCSVFRLFLIDFVEDRYGLNIRPDYLIGKCYQKLRHKA